MLYRIEIVNNRFVIWLVDDYGHKYDTGKRFRTIAQARNYLIQVSYAG